MFHFLFIKFLAGTKVNNLNLVGVIRLHKQKIFRLEVPMHDFMRMAIGNCRHHLFEDNSCQMLVKVMFFNYKVKELPSSAKFSHDVEIKFILEKFVNFDNVWMVDFL